MADDLGYEGIGANGGTSYQTPHLDALARAGMRFTQAYSTPLCTPSRVQLMTGKYNFRNYIGFGLLDPAERTFAHLLQDAGYQTLVVGKWQLFGTPEQRLAAGRTGAVPTEAGFDEYCVWQIGETDSRFKNPRLHLNSLTSQVVTGAFGPDVFVDCIDEFVERHQDQSFLVYYPMAFTHKPFHPLPGHPDYDALDPNLDPSDPAFFPDNVAYMDRMVGRIVHRLDSLGLRDNTLLLFTTDNGTNRGIFSQLGDRLVQGGKGLTTEAGTHAPLIANWPGTIPPGRVNDNLVDFTDFLPTLVDVAGIAPPGDFLMDGLSFYGQLIEQADSVRSWIFLHYDARWNDHPFRRYVQDQEWKLYEDGSFFHVSEDPDEAFPVADDALTDEQRQRKQRFQEVLDQMQ